MNDMLKTIARTFLMVTAGAFLAMALITSIFSIDKMLHVNDLWRIFLVALFSGLTNLVFYSSRELSARSLLLRKTVQFILIISVLLFLAFRWEWLESGESLKILFFVILFMGIYACTMMVAFYREKRTAEQLNNRLREYNNRKLK